MLTVNATAAVIGGIPLITVNAKSVRAEVRASDSGVNMKLYAVHPRHIYYFLRFCTINSHHYVTGQLGVSAYCFDDSNRAFASVRVGVRLIRPIFEQLANGELRRTQATTVEEDVGSSPGPTKLRFILYKYVLENWENPIRVATKRVSKEAFGRQLHALYEKLIQQSILDPIVPPIVLFTERQVDARVMETLRPSAESLAMNSVVLVEYNNEVRRTDFELEGMSLEDLCNAREPWHPAVFLATAENIISTPMQTV